MALIRKTRRLLDGWRHWQTAIAAHPQDLSKVIEDSGRLVKFYTVWTHFLSKIM